MVDEAWIRGEIECCDLHPSDHSRRMKAALLELLAAREVIDAAQDCVKEVSWYAHRKKDLADLDSAGKPWADMLTADLHPLIARLRQYGEATR